MDVRPGTEDDLADIVPLAPVIGRHQVASPVFARVGADFFDQLEESHREELADPEAHYLVARVDGAAVGFAIWYDGIDGPFMASSYAELSVAAVSEQARGQGVGLALTAATIEAARAQGVTPAGHRLAHHEPAVVAVLAGPRVPGRRLADVAQHRRHGLARLALREVARGRPAAASRRRPEVGDLGQPVVERRRRTPVRRA